VGARNVSSERNAKTGERDEAKKLVKIGHTQKACRPVEKEKKKHWQWQSKGKGTPFS